MQLYGATLSPFVRKVAVVLIEKGLPFDLVPVSLRSQNEAFLAISPLGKMPAFRDGDFGIADSSAIIHYLDAKYPEPVLLPAAPEDRARTIWFDEFADTMLAASGGKIFFNRIVSPRFLQQPGNAEMAEQGIAELPRLFAYLEGAVPGPGGFLIGDTLSIADLAIASPFVNFSHCGVEVDASAYPRLAAWLPSILSRPSFAGIIAQERALLAA